MTIKIKNFIKFLLLVLFLIYFSACSKMQESISTMDSTCKADGCHITASLKKYPPDTALHGLHLARGFICENCHYNYSNNKNHKNGIIDNKKHKDGIFNGGKDPVLVSFDKSSPYTQWDNSTGTCSNIDCHGGGYLLAKKAARNKAVAPLVESPKVSWYTLTLGDCTVCHYEGSIIDPLTTGGENIKGKHIAHVKDKTVDCVICHEDYRNKVTHMNGVYGKTETFEITKFGGSYNSFPVSSDFEKSSGACDNISCHGGSGGVNWYSDANGCTLCHTPGSSTDPRITNGTGEMGKHIAHVTNSGIECTICHDNYKDQLTHINGTYGFLEPDTIVFFGGEWPNPGDTVSVASFDYDNGPPASGTYGQCSSISCHAGGSSNWYDTESGCLACHNSPQGSRRLIVTPGGDFSMSSHHVVGDVTENDCKVCHDQAQHMLGTINLKNVDTGALVVYDGTGASLENFCLNCHDSDGASHLGASAMTPFSDGKTVPNVNGLPGSEWDNSAHKTIGYSGNSNNPLTCVGDGTTDGCHSNGHSSTNMKLLAGADFGSNLETFCYTCHTDSMITNNALSGSGLADDIEQSFSLSVKHDLGTTFNTNFKLQCTSCHNPHIVTGKHWSVDLGKSAVTRPDFSDPVNNPRAMGNSLWGTAAGEKMDDYAGSGTYRTPNNDTFSGSELPDYVTLCQDCHGSMSLPGGHGNLNWSGDPHGKNSANVPNGGGTSPNRSTFGKIQGTGSYGEPAQWPVLPRGRGEQIWSRGPYNQEERIAGANFTLSCTDCHEAHGSGVSSMLRTTVNNGPGTVIWNNMCNNCHYYYSTWHAGMSCGNASCHVTNSIHRMDNKYGSGATRTFYSELVADLRFENNLNDNGSYRLHARWDPDGGTGTFVTGHNSTGKAIQVNGQFVEPGTTDGNWSNHLGYHGTHAYFEMKYNLSVEGWVYPTTYDRNVHVVVSSGPSNSNYRLQLEKIGNEYFAVFQVNVNGGLPGNTDTNGWRGAYSTVPVPLNKWAHIAATYDATQYNDDYDAGDLSKGRIRIYVNGEDVTTNDLLSTNYNKTQPLDGEGEGGPPLTGNGLFVQSDRDCGGYPCGWRLVIGSRPYESSLDDFKGRIDDIKIWNITKQADFFDSQIPPVMATVKGAAGYNKLQVTFTEGVYTGTGASGALMPGDFIMTDVNGDNTRVIVSVEHTAGESEAVITMNVPLIAADLNTDKLSAASVSSIYDNLDIAMGTNQEVITELSCPIGTASFQLNEAVGSLTALDDSGLLSGDVNTPLVSLLSDGLFHGDEGQATSIDFLSNDTCLKEANTMTIEARVFTSVIDLDYLDANLDGQDDDYDFDNDVFTMLPGGRSATFQKVIQRKRGFQVNIFRANYAGDYVASRAGKARITFKYFTDSAARHTCPHPQWPADTYTGNDARWHEISTDIDAYPLVQGHWYKMKIVFNSDKSGIPGSDGTPVDIFLDDQGTDGNGAGELWSGYKLASFSFSDSQGCKWSALPGDFITTEDRPFWIGDDGNHADIPGDANNNFFKGNIDWVTWKPVADYSGVDDSPK